MENIKTITNESLHRYFTTLSQYGYIDYPETNKVIILSFLEELGLHPMSQYLTDDDLKDITKLIHCISGKTCLIPEIQKVNFTIGSYTTKGGTSGDIPEIVLEHNKLTEASRFLPNQHTIESITGLTEALLLKQNIAEPNLLTIKKNIPESINEVYTKLQDSNTSIAADLTALQAGKQDKLIVGENIHIDENNVISSDSYTKSESDIRFVPKSNLPISEYNIETISSWDFITGQNSILNSVITVKPNESIKIFDINVNKILNYPTEILVNDINLTGTISGNSQIFGNYELQYSDKGLVFVNNTSNTVNLRDIQVTGELQIYTVLNQFITDNSYINCTITNVLDAKELGILPVIKYTTGQFSFTALNVVGNTKNIDFTYYLSTVNDNDDVEIFYINDYTTSNQNIEIPKSQYELYNLLSSHWEFADDLLLYDGEMTINAGKSNNLMLGDYTSMFGKPASEFKLTVFGSQVLIGERVVQTSPREYSVYFSNDEYQIDFNKNKIRFRNNSVHFVTVNRLELLNSNLYQYVITNPSVTVNSFIRLIIRSDSVEIARAAKMFASGQFEEGKIKIFASNIPTGDIELQYLVMDSDNIDNIDSFYVENLKYNYTEIDSKLGEINLILDNINGEVI